MLGLGLLLIVSSAFAAEPNVPGELSVTVFVSPTDTFIADWLETQPEHGPTIKRIKEAKANQLVYVGFVVTGYTRARDRTAALDVDVRVLDPSGEELFQQDGFARYSGSPARRGFLLADPVLELMIEPTDPMGRYTIEAVAHDRDSGRAAKGQTALDIAP